LRAVRAHHRAAAGGPHAAGGALRSDVVAIEPLQFGIQVRDKYAFLRSELQGIRKRLISLGQKLPPIAGVALSAVDGC
jgi:hypothetical protein